MSLSKNSGYNQKILEPQPQPFRPYTKQDRPSLRRLALRHLSRTGLEAPPPPSFPLIIFVFQFKMVTSGQAPHLVKHLGCYSFWLSFVSSYNQRKRKTKTKKQKKKKKGKGNLEVTYHLINKNALTAAFSLPWLQTCPEVRTISIDKKKISSATQGTFSLACLEIKSRNEQAIDSKRNMIYWLKVFYFLLYQRRHFLFVSELIQYACQRRPEIRLRSQAIRVYKYTKIQGPRFQRNNIIARDPKSDLYGTSFQSSPKINHMLITRQFAYNNSLQHPTISVLLIKILIYFFSDHSVVFTCSKVINAFKRQNSWTDTLRKSSKFNLS